VRQTETRSQRWYFSHRGVRGGHTNVEKDLVFTGGGGQEEREKNGSKPGPLAYEKGEQKEAAGECPRQVRNQGEIVWPKE